MLVAPRKIFAAWDRFWFSPLDPLPCALFRIAGGALYLAMMMLLLPNWTNYFGMTGMAGALGLNRTGWAVVSWIIGAGVNEHWVWALAMILGVSYTVGFFSRTSAAALFVLHSSLIHINPIVVNGEDLIYRLQFFYGMFMPLGKVLSVDARLAKSVVERPALAWPVRLFQIHIALIYFVSLPLKLYLDPAWRDGDAMYYVMINATWSRRFLPQLFYSPEISTIASYMAIIVEGAFVFLCWSKRTRLPMVLTIAGFHLFIAIVLQNVTFFSLTMVVSFVLFPDAAEWRRVGAWVRANLSPRRIKWFIPRGEPA